jgi:hypothetical protein
MPGGKPPEKIVSRYTVYHIPSYRLVSRGMCSEKKLPEPQFRFATFLNY